MYKLYNPEQDIPEVGDIFMVAISTILETWVSGDGGSPEITPTGQSKWDKILEGKRNDGHYPRLVIALQDKGFKCPLTAQVPDGYRTYSFSDGHHRLAAAIELGMSHVPIRFSEYWSGAELPGWDY